MKKEDISLRDYNLLKEKFPNIEDALKILNTGYPIQYLIGNVEFLNTLIYVDERVLIPRFETEYLSDKIIKLNPQHKSILELGAGSGAISIALKKNLECNITAIDISEDAITLAKHNALVNNVDINFLVKDMREEPKHNYDIIVSNPPYIPKNGYVDKNVLKYEPHLALFAEDEGLYYYKVILDKYLNHVNKNGLIALEIGDNLKDKLIPILDSYNLKYEFFNDLQGLPRYLFMYKIN